MVANFESAIRQTTGDVIVLADQDDIWHRDKLATIHQALSQHADWGMVFSDANLVDRNGCSLKQSLWESLRLGQVQRDQLQSPHAFDLLLRRYLVTGATLAFRREFLGILLPFSKHLIHDAWIALVIPAVSKIGLIERPLIDYRQHPKQVIGERNAMRSWWTQFNAARTMSDDYFVRQRDFFRDLANRIESLRSSWVHSEVGRLAESKANFMDRRIRHRASRFRSLSSGLLKDMISGDYSRFGYGWKSAAQDLLL